nr:hypothetical protein BaRGS_016848 [Batillaria attramentaria]
MTRAGDSSTVRVKEVTRVGETVLGQWRCQQTGQQASCSVYQIIYPAVVNRDRCSIVFNESSKLVNARCSIIKAFPMAQCSWFYYREGHTIKDVPGSDTETTFTSYGQPDRIYYRGECRIHEMPIPKDEGDYVFRVRIMPGGVEPDVDFAGTNRVDGPDHVFITPFNTQETSVTLQCFSAGTNPMPEITWHFESIDVSRVDEEDTYKDGSYYIRTITIKIGPSDKGRQVNCTAKNPKRINSLKSAQPYYIGGQGPRPDPAEVNRDRCSIVFNESSKLVNARCSIVKAIHEMPIPKEEGDYVFRVRITPGEVEPTVDFTGTNRVAHPSEPRLIDCITDYVDFDKYGQSTPNGVIYKEKKNEKKTRAGGRKERRREQEEERKEDESRRKKGKKTRAGGRKERRREQEEERKEDESRRKKGKKKEHKKLYYEYADEKSVTLKCFSAGTNPMPDITWHYDNIDVSRVDIGDTYKDGSYYIRTLTITVDRPERQRETSELYC